MAFDSTRIVAQMTIKGSLPEGRFLPQELLDFAYDSLLSEFVPAVLDAREDFYVTHQDLAVTQDKASYFVPVRAINGVLREVKLVKSSGTIVDLKRIDMEQANTSQTEEPTSFYMQGNSVVLYPTPSETSGTLRLFYFMRPSNLVPVSECGLISAIDTGTNTVTVTIPTGWTTGNTFDLVRGRSHFDILSIDLAASSVAGGSITFASALPSTLVVGDYVTLSEETCFPSLPPEGHVALIQSAVTSALESMGEPAAGLSAQKAASLRTSFQTILKTRVLGAPKALGKRLL